MRKALMVVMLVVLSISGCSVIDDLKIEKRDIHVLVMDYGVGDPNSTFDTQIVVTHDDGSESVMSVRSNGGFWTGVDQWKVGSRFQVSVISPDNEGQIIVDVECDDCGDASEMEDGKVRRTIDLATRNELVISFNVK
jgi:hypothetical protein